MCLKTQFSTDPLAQSCDTAKTNPGTGIDTITSEDDSTDTEVHSTTDHLVRQRNSAKPAEYNSDDSTVTELSDDSSIETDQSDEPESGEAGRILEAAREILSKPDNNMAWEPKRLSPELYPSMPTSARRAIAEQNKNLPSYLDQPNLCPEYLDDQIRRLERELSVATSPFVSALVAKRIEEKKWCRNNREALALLDSRMDDHRWIVSIRYEPGKGHFALFYLHNDTLRETDITPDFARELLMPQALKSGRYNCKNWVKIRFYDLRRNVMNTEFKYVQKVDYGRYDFWDSNGVPVRVPWQIAQKIARAETLEKAAANRTEMPTGSVIRWKSSKDSELAKSPDAGPVVHFRNSGGLCAESALCSGMHSFGLVDPSNALFGLYQNKRSLPGSKKSQFRELEKCIRRVLSGSCKAVALCKRGRYDPLDSRNRRQAPVLAELRAKRINDGGRWEDIGINHCVCFLGDWVFDGNMRRALRISRDSLDRICASIQDGAMYNRIAWHKELQLTPRPIKEED